jgi:predicted metalloprotease
VDGPAYCPYDGTLYYPLHWLDNGRTLADYGRSAVEWGVAHEIGHHAQVQMDELGIQRMDVIPADRVELQADCFAGMYADQAITQPGGVEAALAAMMDAGGPEHGTSQQRIAAFELGYNTGDLSRCLALATDGTTTGGGRSEGVSKG